MSHLHDPLQPRGHAVTIVGYTSDRFIIRNSWGEGWGDNGFAYASLSYAQDAFKFRNFNGGVESNELEAYGIAVY